MSTTTSLGQLLRERLERDKTIFQNPEDPKIITDEDIRWIQKLNDSADNQILDTVSSIFDKINKANVMKFNSGDLAQLNRVSSVLETTKWDTQLHHRLTELVQENHTHARHFNSLFKIGRELTLFVNHRFARDVSAGSYGTSITEDRFEKLNDKLFNAFQDILYLRPSKMVSYRRGSFYEEWSSINTPQFMTRALNNHPGIWRVLADAFVALNTLGRVHVKNYGDVYKHAKPKSENMMDYWRETVALYNNESKIFTASQDLYKAESDSIPGQRVRTFWFKQALRNKVTFEDIIKEPAQVSDLILQTAALMYINKEHPMIGNFLKTVIPMLRESIDSGLITKQNYKTVNVQMLSYKIESYDLPDDLGM